MEEGGVNVAREVAGIETGEEEERSSTIKIGKRGVREAVQVANPYVAGEKKEIKTEEWVSFQKRVLFWDKKETGWGC